MTKSPITDYRDQIAVVTGGASGIGKALCEALAKRGAKVVVSDVEKGALDATVEELSAATGGELVAVQCDVTDEAAVDALADEAYNRFGRVNLLFLNAGVGAPGAKVWETTPNDWRWVHSVNVLGVAFGIQAFVPRMIDGGEPGHVITTTSGDGAISPMPTASVYAASKAAMSITTECLAAQLAEVEANIGVSLFFPSGRGLLPTGLYTGDRNRPDKWAREKPRPTEAITIDKLQERAKAAGYELPIQPLDELAEAVLDQVLAGTYAIALGGLEGMAGSLHQRADRFAAGQVPVEAQAHGMFS